MLNCDALDPQHVTNLYLFIHLLADTQQHQHVVALGDAHGVEVTEDVGAGDPAL